MKSNASVFVAIVGGLLTLVFLILGIVANEQGRVVYKNTLGDQPEYESHMPFPMFLETVEWEIDGVYYEHTADDNLRLYDEYLEENLSIAAKKADAAAKPYREEMKERFVVAGIIFFVSIVLILVFEAIEYKKSARYG